MAAKLSTSERLGRINEAFLPSAPVHRQELLAGRKDQLFKLLEVTQTPGAHAAIFGERGVGKTSVASVFENDLSNRQGRVVRINCSAMDSFQTLWQQVFEEWLALDPTELEANALSALIGTHVSQAILVRKLGAISTDQPVVIIFDEFDVIADDGVGEDFANLMKAISDKASTVPIRLVIVGVAEDVDSILMGHASAARGLHQIKLPRLDDAELRSVVANGLGQVPLTEQAEITSRIVAISQGLPHYTHLLGKEVARRAILAGRDFISLDDWRPALQGALDLAEQKIVDLYNTAVTTAKPSMFPALLIACGLAPKGDQGFFRPTDVHGPLNELSGKNYAMASFTGNLASLASADRGPALQSREFGDRRKRYRFADPLLQPYVLGKAILDGAIDLNALDRSDLWG